MEPKDIPTIYTPTDKETQARDKSYKFLQQMIDLKHKAMPHFSGPNGQRSWLSLIDDSEKILNGYTLSRAEQGKEEWQSNMMDNVSRVKMRATVAGIALKVPEMHTGATDGNGMKSTIRAEVIKNIVRQTFQDTNPVMAAFYEAWHLVGHGLVVNYEGYKTGGAMRDRVTSFDSVTGEVETKKEYVKMDGKPYSVLLDPQEFYWWDFFTRDVQDQQRIAWVQHYSKAEIELEFSKFKNHKFIKDKAETAKWQPLQQSLFYGKWKDRVQTENDYEVFRLYDKERDLYEVWINGVPMIRCPILWGDKEKVYPFSKQTSEPYANTNFFVGMPWGQIMEAYQDQKNTVQNTLADKLYRSMKKPFLYGLNNKDLFDIQDQFVDEDNKFYVPDINQVKPFPYEGIGQGELAFLTVIDRNIASSSVDSDQQGQSTGNKTARESVIADQRAREIKSILYNSLEDFWLQKTKLRSQIIITHFLQDKAIQDSVGGQIFEVKDYTFGDGSRGILAIHIAKTKAKLLSQQEVEAREQAMESQGIAYKLISITKDWLDDWKYDYSIVPQSFHNQEIALKEDAFNSEVQWLVTLAPEFYLANKDKYLAEKLSFRGKHIDEF